MELLSDVGHVESHLVCLEMVFVLVQDRCTVCAERTIGSDIVLDEPDGTPRGVHGLRKTYHRLRYRFGRNRWNS